MGYEGIIAELRCGRGGLMTDMNPADIPDTHLILAENIDIQNGLIQKDFGSRKWNQSALPSGVAAFLDWFPAEHLQRFIALTKAGKLYQLPDSETQTEITATSPAPASLIITQNIQPMLVTGGNESPGNARKIFVFTGNSQIQVISGDSTTRTNIEGPSADWDSAGDGYPRGGIVHRNRLWVFKDHRMYASNPEDHEDFLEDSLQFAVYPGEGEQIIATVVFKTKLFVLKGPFGIYGLVDDDPDSDNWYFSKISDEFGAVGPDSQIGVSDDLLVANSTGTVTSIAASMNLGDIEAGDIFSIMKVENYLRGLLASSALSERRALFYAEKKVAYFAARSSGNLQNDRMLKIDFSNGRPEMLLVTKDQANCFALRKVLNRKMPYYGAENGWIYEMDRMDRNVGGSAYTGRFQTPFVDFSYMDQKLGQVNKIFDFFEVEFVPTGRFDLSVDYFIDGRYIDTITMDLDSGPALDDFTLDTDRLTSTKATSNVIKKISGYGRAISFRPSNGTANQNFKIAKMKVYFRPGNENRKSPNSGRA